MKKYISILIGILSVAACSENDDSVEPQTVQADRVIFGGIYGMCGGDCRDLYLINNEGLFKDADDVSDEYGDWANTSFEEELDREEYEDIEDLFEVPSG